MISAAKFHSAPLEKMFDESEGASQQPKKALQQSRTIHYSDEEDFLEDEHENEEEEDDITDFIEEDMDDEESSTLKVERKSSKHFNKSPRASVLKTQLSHSSSTAFSEYDLKC